MAWRRTPQLFPKRTQSFQTELQITHEIKSFPRGPAGPFGEQTTPMPMSSDAVREPTLLRKVAARTVDGLWSVIGRLVDLFTPQECANCFTATSMMQPERKPL